MINSRYFRKIYELQTYEYVDIDLQITPKYCINIVTYSSRGLVNMFIQLEHNVSV